MSLNISVVQQSVSARSTVARGSKVTTRLRGGEPGDGGDGIYVPTDRHRGEI